MGNIRKVNKCIYHLQSRASLSKSRLVINIYCLRWRLNCIILSGRDTCQTWRRRGRCSPRAPPPLTSPGLTPTSLQWKHVSLYLYLETAVYTTLNIINVMTNIITFYIPIYLPCFVSFFLVSNLIVLKIIHKNNFPDNLWFTHWETVSL